MPDPKTNKFKLALNELLFPYKRLWPYLKPYRRIFVFAVSCGIVGGWMNFVLLMVMKKAGGTAFGSGSLKSFGHMTHAQLESGPGISHVAWICATIPLIMMTRSLLNYMDTYWLGWVGSRMVIDLRADVFKRVMNQSLGFFMKRQAGDLMSRISRDTQVAQSTLTSMTKDIVVQPMTLIACMGALFYTDWKFSLVAIVVFPICIIPMAVFGRRVRHLSKGADVKGSALLVTMHEAFSGIRVIKGMAREEYEVGRFRDEGMEQFLLMRKITKWTEMVGPLVEVVGAVGAGMALFYVWYSQMKVGEFFAIFGAMFLMYDPAKRLGRIYMQLQKCIASVIRVFDLIEHEPTVKNSPTAIALSSAQGHIEFEDVSFSYVPGSAAVEHVSLIMEPGKTYALVGASGAGKSTMLSLILRFYDPESGVIRIDGRDLRDVTQESLRDQMSIVTQDTFLFHDTIYKNIQYGRFEATEEQIHAAAQLAYAHDFIMEKEKGYETVIGDKGNMLSGGQQQRLAIARALLRNSPILLLDEATSALDSESEKQIQMALERLSQGRTVVAIAHRLSTILNADQIVVMDNGRVVETGTHAELFEQSGHYRRLYDLQFGGSNETVNQP